MQLVSGQAEPLVLLQALRGLGRRGLVCVSPQGNGTLACVGNPAQGPQCWHKWSGGVRVPGRSESFFCVCIICWSENKSENNTYTHKKKKTLSKKPVQLSPVKQTPNHQWENTGWVNLPLASLLGLHKLHKKSSLLSLYYFFL